MKSARALVVLLLLLLLGCGERTDAWTPIGDGAASEAQRAQIERGQRAWQALGQALLGELTAALGDRGAVGAIDVCRLRAPAIAAAVAAAHRVRIGRTSQRLRNPANGAPAWAASTVAAGSPAPVQFAGPDGAVGLLQPILLMPLCTQCHGAPAQLAPGVGEALARAYPDDRATGFTAGELRGWFWVEVPGS